MQAFIKAKLKNETLCVLLPSKDHARTGVRVQAGCRVSARMLQEHPRVERGAPLAGSRRINQNTSRGNAACGRRCRRVKPPPQRSQEDLDELCVRSGSSVVPKRRRAQMPTLCVCPTRPRQLRSGVGVRKHDQTRGTRTGLPCAGSVHQKLEVLQAGLCPLRRIVRGNAIDANVPVRGFSRASASLSSPHPVDAKLKLEQAGWNPCWRCRRVRRVRRDGPVQRRHGQGVRDQELLEQRILRGGARLRRHADAAARRCSENLQCASADEICTRPKTPCTARIANPLRCCVFDLAMLKRL